MITASQTIWDTLGEHPSATVVLAVFCVMLALGLFTPRWVTTTILKAKDAEIGRWREAWTLSEAARQEERRQTDQILDGLKELSEGQALTTSIMQGIRTAVGEPHRSRSDE